MELDMTRSDLMPTAGKRLKMLKRLGRQLLCAALACTVSYVAIRETILKNFKISEDQQNNIIFSGQTASPSEDELNAAIDEADGGFILSQSADDLPSALELYDKMYLLSKTDEDKDKNEIISTSGLKIVGQDLSRNPESPDTILLTNRTSFKVDAGSLLDKNRYKTINTGASIQTSAKPASASEKPLVLIIHTHGTEGYASEHSTAYEKNNMPRSSDITQNVVAVGKVLCETLNENGVPAIHCEIMHDKESYTNSYNYAKKTILEYTKKYPSIKYIYDIHRDAILTDTSMVKAITYDGDTPLAQVMFVVGTNEKGADHPNWMSHLSAAVNIQYILNSKVKNFARPISLRSASFNEQYTEGSLLIEIGTCANTLEEAKRSAVVLGKELSNVILSDTGRNKKS